MRNAKHIAPNHAVNTDAPREIRAGQADWDAPTEREHRAVNVGGTTYEEVAIFFLDHPDDIPQPSAT